MAEFDHEARRHRIGASEIAAILGLNEWQTPLDVWLVKTGRKPPFAGNEHTQRGSRQEAQILGWLADDLGKGILTNCPTIIHEGGLAAATPDGVVCDYMTSILMPLSTWGDFEVFKDQSLAEAKSTLKPFRYNGGTPDFREREISDVPSYWLQCQWQMMCTGLKVCHLAIFGPRINDYQRFEIAYNETFALQMLADAQEWWQTHIIEGKQPEPINERDVFELWPKDDGTSIEAVPMVYEACARHSQLKAQIKDLEARLQPLRDQITRAIGQAQTVRYGGRVIASYKRSNDKFMFKTY